MAYVYLDLKGARERLCRVQTGVTEQHRRELQVALDLIDRLGVYYCPHQWSKYDEPPLPGETPMRPSLEALGFTHVAECAECGHDIFRHPAWTHFGADGKGEGDWDHEATAALGTIRDWPRPDEGLTCPFCAEEPFNDPRELARHRWLWHGGPPKPMDLLTAAVRWAWQIWTWPPHRNPPHTSPLGQEE